MYVNSLAANVELLVMVSLLVSILFCFNLRYWRARLINPLSVIYLLVILGCVLEIGAFIADGHAELIWMNYLCNTLYLMSIGIMAAMMLVYTNEQLPVKLWKKRSTMRLWFIPAAIEMVLLASAPWTHLIFYVDSAGCYHRTSTFCIQFIAYGYLLVTTVVGIYSFKKAQAVGERNFYLAIALFSIPPFFLGGSQLLIRENSLDILEFSIALSLIANYATSQNRRITRDTLTRLPNREMLDIILIEKMRSARRGDSKDKLFVMMGDLDGFKPINDTYGHVEGDKALVCVGDVLYHVMADYKGHAARFGGDEFVLILEAEDERIVDDVIRQISDDLERASKDRPYTLSISIGRTAFRPTDTITDLIRAADRDLYSVKRTKKIHKTKNA